MLEILLTFSCWDIDHWQEVSCGRLKGTQEYVCEAPISFIRVDSKQICIIGD